MKKLTVIYIAALVAVVGAASTFAQQAPRRGECDYWCQLLGGEVGPVERRSLWPRPSDYAMPRSVGAWSQVNDMTQGPEPWWSLTAGHGLTAAGFALRAHPWDHSQNWENVRKAFRTEGIDIIVLWLSHWIATETSCDGSAYVAWQEYPSDVFEQFYKYYGHQHKTVILMTFESDVRLHGKGCLNRDECSWSGLDACIERCEDGTMFVNDWYPEGYVQPDDCRLVSRGLRTTRRLPPNLLRPGQTRPATSDAPRIQRTTEGACRCAMEVPARKPPGVSRNRDRPIRA